jgi:hypothetical protein
MPNVVFTVQNVLQVDPDLRRDDFSALSKAHRHLDFPEATDTGRCRCLITRSA